MLVVIAHTFDQLVYALVSYIPHAFILFPFPQFRLLAGTKRPLTCNWISIIYGLPNGAIRTWFHCALHVILHQVV